MSVYRYYFLNIKNSKAKLPFFELKLCHCHPSNGLETIFRKLSATRKVSDPLIPMLYLEKNLSEFSRDVWLHKMKCGCHKMSGCTWYPKTEEMKRDNSMCIQMYNSKEFQEMGEKFPYTKSGNDQILHPTSKWWTPIRDF